MHKLLPSTPRAWPLSLALILLPGLALADAGAPLPSWNDGAAKRAIVAFVHASIDRSKPTYIPPEERIAVFDNDGTLWVEHPIYTQLAFALDRVHVLAPLHPEWKTTEPFKTVLGDDPAAIGKLDLTDLEAIVDATHSGMTTETFNKEVQAWLATARHPRFQRPYTELVYQPMVEVLRYLRANGFKTYIVTGGGQDFVRAFAQKVYGVPPEQVIGSALATRLAFDDRGQGVLIKTKKLLLDDNKAGKAEDIGLFIGRRPKVAFGNSSGDRQMLEYTEGSGSRLMMLVHHDDATREYAYGPAGGLPDTTVGTFPDALMTEANERGWTIISIKNDWKRLFPDHPRE
jgi:phosphoserine phosphatase